MEEDDNPNTFMSTLSSFQDQTPNIKFITSIMKHIRAKWFRHQVTNYLLHIFPPTFQFPQATLQVKSTLLLLV